MKRLLLLAGLWGMAGLATAQEQARVISSTPIVQQVAVPQQVCQDQTIATAPRTTGGGAVLGAIAGGAAGNTIGGGTGRAAATAIGLIGGALLGNQIEGQGRPPQYQEVQRCTTETFYENRTVGYNVLYEYAGHQYTTRTDRDPGGWISVSVQPLAEGRHGRTYSTLPDGPSQPGRVVNRLYRDEPTPLTPVIITPPVTVIEYDRQRDYYPPPPPPRPYRHHREDWR
ncbi:glycine zipper 2TM domain-containing protein [Giesbergeria anulus]|uniref:Uncharacterized conserved protein YcfJ, contains glycine zipper 2TM domain n=1 Tax=Giesbergeria anulus TaxID=180197 RepID=A0A1H9HJ17_9BURK|nr:glycine zipper 2TM domain-containing protein [Giesbergeria anulus]SEQ62307.1 Uncharacterized conserved protein YcfJ, contains glycine zipper 2TM domain [Giesbergeria anulus]